MSAKFQDPPKYGKNSKTGHVEEVKTPKESPQVEEATKSAESAKPAKIETRIDPETGNTLCADCGAVVAKDGTCGHGQACRYNPNGPKEQVRRLKDAKHRVSQVAKLGTTELLCGNKIIAASIKNKPTFDVTCPVCGMRVLVALNRKNNFVVAEYKVAEDGSLEAE